MDLGPLKKDWHEAHVDELSLGSEATKHSLLLGEVQPTHLPAEPHSASVFLISQTLDKLYGEILQQTEQGWRRQTCGYHGDFPVELRNSEVLDKQGTLMLSTRDPGGDSCRAMVSEVSIVKYTSMLHSSCTVGKTHAQSVNSLLKRCRILSDGVLVSLTDTLRLAVSQGCEKEAKHKNLQPQHLRLSERIRKLTKNRKL